MKQYSKNPRQITEKQFTQLGSTLHELGDLSGIVHDLNSDEIIGGNQRSRVFDINKCNVEIVEQLDQPDEQGTVAHGFVIWEGKRYAYRQVRWDAKQCEKANIVANKAGGTWDFDTLANEFELDELLEWGFDKKELDLDLWAGEPADDPGAQVDKAEELREKWGVESGQLWQLGEHRLICGDCTDRATVERLGEFDLILTDPPYGISVVSNLTSTDGAGKPVTIGAIRGRRKDTFGGVKAIGSADASNWVDATLYHPVIGDDKPFEPAFLLELECDKILFGGNYYASKLPDSRCWIVWDKNNTGNFADAELAWTSFETGVKLYKFTWNGLVREGERAVEGKKRMHPTQKPVGLFEMILNDFSEEGDVVADFYLGSGTTLIACERLGRKCRAVEISPAYCAVTIQRWVDMTGETPVLLD